LKPCDENLATQIEEGYIKLKPFRTQAPSSTKVPSSPTSPISPISPTDKDKLTRPSPQQPCPQIKPKEALSDIDAKPPSRSSSPFRFATSSSGTQVETAKKEMIWKLLGEQHMGKYVVYTNATTAWLLSDDLYGKLTSSVYQTLTAGIHLGGAKLVRGYTEPTKSKVQDKEVSETKRAPTTAKEIGKKDVIDDVADRAEEKEMEEDYENSEKEDPNRFQSFASKLIQDKSVM
jgi:hypothetical protein